MRYTRCLLCSGIDCLFLLFVQEMIDVFGLYVLALFVVAHTPDNSFLGFVVGEFRRNRMPLQKENIAVVYGKELYMWKVKGGARNLL